MINNFKLKKIKLIKKDKALLGISDTNQLPHKIKRVFFVKTGLNDVRGKHGHKKCWQSLICLEGRIKVDIINKLGNKKKVILKEDIDVLIIPPGNWAMQTGLSEKNILLVLTSDLYDKHDYFYDKPKIKNK